MFIDPRSWLRRARQVLAVLATSGLMAACGGGQAPSADASLAAADAAEAQSVLIPVPAGQARARAQSAVATTLRVHYHRSAADYTGWQIHTWGAGNDPGWNQGWNAAGNDDYGVYYDVPLNASSGTVGFLLHNGDNKDNGGADQSYTLNAGANEIWRLQNDSTNYAQNPLAVTLDIATVRVHYKRFAGDYANWGLHLWGGSGLDTARLPAGLSIGDWNNPTPFSALANYSLGTGEIVFDLPVVNPRTSPGSTSLEFVLHGMAPNQNDKDGWTSNVHIEYGALAISGQVGEVWLVEQDPQVHVSAPDTRSVSSTDARAVWLDGSLIKWPRVAAGGTVKLYASATGQIVVARDALVSGADRSITLDAFTGTVPTEAATRFKYLAGGAVYQVRSADQAALKGLLTQQLVLVQEDADGRVQNATTLQVAGALDALYAAAYDVSDLGVHVAGGNTIFKLWAPTAQGVALYLYPNANDPASKAVAMTQDAATGIWQYTARGDHSGQYYRFGVRTFVRGVGVVRNIVTDPYSVSLSGNSQRSFVADLASPAYKPAGWDASQPPATVAVSPDMSIYELHIRDFSVSDASVPAEHRGKYLAFTDAGSHGMKHLRALAQAGLTDVHLLPTFDYASVDEKHCVTPAPVAASPDDSAPQALVAATAAQDCFNWGYAPYHFNAPEGSYASAVSDGHTRIVEFRRMVQALNKAGLRVGMDLVFNHTSASGQNDHSVLDRIVPGYYHRLDAAGNVLRDLCCDDTATENHMMGKLMIDSAIVWARDYHVSSIRFDIMGMLPRAVLEELKAKVAVAAGRPVQLLGEGWNFGAVANGARFVQAEMNSLNGSGIGSFNPFIRDAVRGGSGFDTGTAQFANQGYINGLWFDPNAYGTGGDRGTLAWYGDLIRSSLAGSIRSYVMTTSWDATLPLEQINVGGIPAGFVVDPAEVVNYVENHDNTTLFDNNVWKLPTATSREDRARVQMLGAAINSFAQGISYFHAGIDTLRSKSMDKNSYDAGDWFNRLDWTYADDNFGVGLPGANDNGSNWDLLRPLLTNAAIKPTSTEIGFARDQFRDLLKIRKSTTLLRLRTADDIKARLRFFNTGSQAEPTVLVGDLDGSGYAGANFAELAYFVNVDKQEHQLSIAALKGKAFALHPVHRAANAADKRAAQARYDAATGSFTIPARTAVVFVVGGAQ